MTEVRDPNRFEEFEKALLHPKFSHVSVRDYFGGIACVYHHDSTSPSGVSLAGGLNFAEAEPILKRLNKSFHHGPQRGDIAASQWGIGRYGKD